jgi:hypothetical protein
MGKPKDLSKIPGILTNFCVQKHLVNNHLEVNLVV